MRRRDGALSAPLEMKVSLIISHPIEEWRKESMTPAAFHHPHRVVRLDLYRKCTQCAEFPGGIPWGTSAVPSLQRIERRLPVPHEDLFLLKVIVSSRKREACK